MKSVIIGRPGTGKTHYLMDLLENIKPENTIFISYTRAAIQEARARASKKWNVQSKDIIYFKTIHSLCSRLLGLGKEDFLDEKMIMDFMVDHGIDYMKQKGIMEMVDGDDEFNINAEDTIPDGNKLMGLLSRIKNVACVGIDEIDTNELNELVSDFVGRANMRNTRYDDINTVIAVLKEFEAFRGARLHFTDILIQFIKTPVFNESIDNLIVDEFQDVSPLSYKIIKYLESQTKMQFYAGDPHQAIYSFIGATPKFLNEEYNQTGTNKIVLPKSYRMKSKIWEYAKYVINSNCKDKIEDVIDVEIGGSIKYFTNPELVISGLASCKTDRNFVLTRTNLAKRGWMELFDDRGVVYGVYGRGARIWISRMIAANNFIYYIKGGLPVPCDDAREFIKDCIPSKPLLRRGVKARIKTKEIFKSESVSINEIRDILTIGYNIQDLTKTNILKLSLKQKEVLDTKLSKSPGLVDIKIWIGTIHSVKGMEADVVVYDASMSGNIVRSVQSSMKSREEEARIAYVSITRARSELWIFGNNAVLGNG